MPLSSLLRDSKAIEDVQIADNRESSAQHAYCFSLSLAEPAASFAYNESLRRDGVATDNCARNEPHRTTGSLGAGVPGWDTDGPGAMVLRQVKWAFLKHSLLPHWQVFIIPMLALKQTQQRDPFSTPSFSLSVTELYTFAFGPIDAVVFFAPESGGR
jgi:hypothetical protein